MKIIKKINDQYFIDICPRLESEIVTAKARSKASNSVQSLEVTTTSKNNIITVQLIDFEPKKDAVYEIYLYDLQNDVVWFGQSMYTEE